MSIKQVSARFAAGAVGAAMIVSLGLGAASPAFAAGLSANQVSSILSLLQSFGADQNTINNVQSALTGQATTGTTSTTSTSPAASCSASFSRALTVGSTGSDVKALQVLLNSSAATQIAKTGAGSPGMETSTFGPATKAAVMKFQAAHGLAQVGNVGPATRAALNAMCGVTTTTTTTTTNTTVPSGPGVTVAMAATQPANTLAPKNASRVPFTTFTLTNNTANAVTINSVTVQRAGLAQDAVFSGIVLLDQGGLQVGIAHTFNSNHQTNIGDNFVLAAGASMTYTVAGNMAADESAYSGQVASLQVVAVNTSVAVNGSLPIMGASQTINNSLSIGTYSTSTSSYDPGGNQTKNIGDTNVRFSGLRITASSAEDVKFYSIRWRQVGTAGASDFGNVKTVVDGTSYPTTVDSSGKYYTTVFPNGILIAKGNSSNVYIQGDMTGTNSASRTVVFDIDKSTDVYFVGQLYGYGAVSSQYATAQPWFHTGFTTLINAGSASVIQNATSVASANVPVNVTGTVLGGFQTNFIGEPVSVSGLKFTITTTGTSTAIDGITSVSIVDQNGAVVAGPVDATVSSVGGSETLSFTDTVTFPVGLQTYTLKGKIPADWPNGALITLSTTANSTNWTNATGQTSGNSISLPNTPVTMNQMTVKGATLAISASPSPVAQSITAGTMVVLGNVQLDASQSGEDLRLNSIKLYEVGSGVTTNILNTCQLYNGSTALNTGSNVINSVTSDGPGPSPAGTNATVFTFDNALVVAKGTVLTLTAKCNISSGASGTYSFGVYTTGTPSATGVQSGNTLGSTLTVATGASGLQNVSTGSFAIAVDSSSPSFALAPAGTSGVTVGVLRLRAASENVSLTKLGLTLTNSGNTRSSGTGASTNSGVNDLAQIYIYQGSTLVGTAQFTGNSATVATSSLSTPVTLTKDTDVLLTVKADLATIGVSGAAGIGDVVKVDPLNAQGSGLSSGLTVNAVAAAGVAGVQMFKSYPTLAAGTSVAANPIGTSVLKRFTVTANSAGAVGLYQIAVNLSTSSATVTNLKLYAYTDSGYSQPANVPNTTAGQFGGTAALGASDIAAPTVAFIQGTPLQVSAGQTLYFTVVGTVSPTASANNWTVNTTVLGDSASTTAVAGYNANFAQTVGVATNALGVATSSISKNFVWSDNATTTATTATLDWVDGYYVPGLPSSGF